MALVAMGASLATASAASATEGGSATGDPRVDTVYNSMPAVAPASHPSFGFAATSTREMGDRITLAGEARVLDSLTVGLNSWACEQGSGADCVTTPGATFEEPVTVHFYEVGVDGAVGEEIASYEQTFAIPFRPSADTDDNCGSASQWYDADKETCQNGFTVPVTFDLANEGIQVPSDVIVSFSYPTSRFGELPSGPWDSLNLDTVPDAPSIGADVDADELYVDSDWADMYAAGDAKGTFHATGDYTGYALNMTVTARPATAIDEVTAYVQDFESGTDGLSSVSQRWSESSLLASAGCHFATAPETGDDADAMVSTYYGGKSTLFPEDGYTTSADFYLDAEAAEGQFTWSHAVNGTDGKHQRDFVFVVGADGAGTWTIGAGNNVGGKGATGYGEDTLSVTESGWYTLEHTFYAVDGLLYADLTVLDAAGDALGVWELGGQAADRVPEIVGGSRYGWLVTNTYEGLPIDNVVLGADRPSDFCAPFEDVTSDPSSEFYTPHAGEIAWMQAEGLAKGWPTATGAEYRPWTGTTRDAFAAFLYRQAGSPAITGNDWPFVDVSPIAGKPGATAHWKAIVWMGQTGLSNGWATPSGAEFRGAALIQRDQLAAFLWRQAGEPTPAGTSPFVDVSDSRVFAPAMTWMYEAGLSQGWTTSDGVEYRPTTATTRDAMAAFLFRTAHTA
ncbi:S-layer homology domain-containing protein [Demequina sp. NBRC 110057]|uniref:S-layer homology domain-containing protein n=1 Tax=Demequina sp. NBRC 110057 TaxID=1570346 RepID=UPI000A0091AB|nr:S-layer homology domain-containing protein [Demequina sp. NBRC 110057]